VPRGFVHTTATSDSFSVHVTLGITVYTWIELLAEWVRLSKHSRSFRGALPPGFAGNRAARLSLGDQLRRMTAELQSMTAYDEFLDSFLKRVLSARVGQQANFCVDVMTTEPRVHS
jgi:hypothetical protein